MEPTPKQRSVRSFNLARVENAIRTNVFRQGGEFADQTPEYATAEARRRVLRAWDAENGEAYARDAVSNAGGLDADLNQDIINDIARQFAGWARGE